MHGPHRPGSGGGKRRARSAEPQLEQQPTGEVSDAADGLTTKGSRLPGGAAAAAAAAAGAGDAAYEAGEDLRVGDWPSKRWRTDLSGSTAAAAQQAAAQQAEYAELAASLERALAASKRIIALADEAAAGPPLPPLPPAVAAMVAAAGTAGTAGEGEPGQALLAGQPRAAATAAATAAGVQLPSLVAQHQRQQGQPAALPGAAAAAEPAREGQLLMSLYRGFQAQLADACSPVGSPRAAQLGSPLGSLQDGQQLGSPRVRQAAPDMSHVVFHLREQPAAEQQPTQPPSPQHAEQQPVPALNGGDVEVSGVEGRHQPAGLLLVPEPPAEEQGDGQQQPNQQAEQEEEQEQQPMEQQPPDEAAEPAAEPVEPAAAAAEEPAVEEAAAAMAAGKAAPGPSAVAEEPAVAHVAAVSAEKGVPETQQQRS